MTTFRWFFLILLAFVCCSLRLINRDFYYDEIYTLSNFLFIPIRDIIQQYKNLNNHVFYSLINAIYLHLINITNIDYILSHPWIIRLPQLLFPTITLIIIYQFSIRFINPRSALFAVLILATTIPFYYYSSTIRGYGLSMALFAGLFYYINTRWYILTGIITALFIYTIPSNAVFIISTGLFCFKDKGIITSLGIGGIIAVILYSPILSGILADPQIQSHASRMRILTESIPETVNAFISYRWLLIPVIVLGLYHQRSRHFWLVSGITIISLAVFMLNGSYLWARVLFPLFPLWCIVTAESIDKAIEKII